MKKALYILTLIVSLNFLSSCNLDILPSDILTEDQMKEAPTGLEDLVNGLYTSYKNRDFIRLMHRMTDFGTDDVVYGHETEDAEINMTFRYYQRNSGLSCVRRHWAQCYSIIYAANVAIEMANTMEATDYVNTLKGEALFLKAFAMHQLVRTYARPYRDDPNGMGIIIRESSTDTGEKERATIGEVYTSILNLLNEAAPLLEGRKSEDRSYDRSLASIGAVNALYSRVYLYMGEWQKCIDYSTKVIGDKTYALTEPENYKNYFINCTKEKETIWNLAYLDNESGPGLATMITLEGDGCWAEEGYSPTILEDMGKGTILESVDARWDFVGPGHAKNGLWLVECTKHSFQGGKKALNSPPIFRLSEIYFNRAEAYAMLNKDSEALADINAVRTKRMKKNAQAYIWKDSDAVKAGSMVELVLKEKRIEFPFEYQRWYDLLRHNKDLIRNFWGFHTSEYLGVSQPGVPGLDKEGVVVKYTDNFFIWPIPNTEITNNPLCKQNPGY